MFDLLQDDVFSSKMPVEMTPVLWPEVQLVRAANEEGTVQVQ